MPRVLDAAGLTVVGFAVGFAAGLLDYSLAVGYGLVAAAILSSGLGLDPRLVASSSALAQLASTAPALLAHRARGNLDPSPGLTRLLLALSLAAAVSAALSSRLLADTSPRAASLAYAAAMASVPAVALAAARGSASRRPMVGLLYALLAGTYKAVVGGGFSLAAVAAARSLGLTAREAVAAMPLVKLAGFTVVAAVYTAHGLLSPPLALGLTAGSLASTPLAAHLLSNLESEKPTVLAPTLVALAASAAKLASTL